jgi:hypothetical protein
MSEILVEREILAYGPATTMATVLTNIPIKPRSVKLFLDNGSVSIHTAYDDGMGNILAPQPAPKPIETGRIEKKTKIWEGLETVPLAYALSSYFMRAFTDNYTSG